jgi:hypothetical protein
MCCGCRRNSTKSPNRVFTNSKTTLPSERDYAITILRSKIVLDEVGQYQVNLKWPTPS